MCVVVEAVDPPCALLGTVPALVEMHAVNLAESNDQHIARVDGEDDEAAYRAACIWWSRWEFELKDV